MDLIETDPFSRQVIGCAIEVHRTLGPGLIESVYEACLYREISLAGLSSYDSRNCRLPTMASISTATCAWTSSSKTR